MCDLVPGQAANPDLVTFSDLPEGQVGRLQVMKSGKARLLLGDHVLKLEPGTQLKFLQVTDRDSVVFRLNMAEQDSRPYDHIEHVRQPGRHAKASAGKFYLNLKPE